MTPKTIHLAAQNDILYLIDRKPCSGGSDCPITEDDRAESTQVLAKIYDSGRAGEALGRAIERRYNLHDELVEALRKARESVGSMEQRPASHRFETLELLCAILAKVDQTEGR